MHIKFTLNGLPHSLDLRPERRLSDVLRAEFNLYSIKPGCYHGICGCCTVLFDEKPMPSCMIPAFSLRGHDIKTVEGISGTQLYEEIADAFYFQGVELCGFCGPSRMLISYALLLENPKPKEEEIQQAFAGLSCRCSGYSQLIRGVRQAAGRKTRRGRVR